MLLTTVLPCAHDKEETKTSLLSSQEVFNVSFNFAHEEGGVKSLPISGHAEAYQDEGTICLA